MTEEPTPGTLVIEAADGGYFAIPRQELDKGKIPADRIGALEDLADRMDTRGLIDGALLPYAENGYYFALPPEVIERYRVLPEKEEEVREVVENDVSGYQVFGSSGASSVFGTPGPGLTIIIANTVVNQYNFNTGINIAFGNNAVLTNNLSASNVVNTTSLFPTV
jgi:hypothetical protein